MWALRATRAVAARSKRSPGYNPNTDRIVEKDLHPSDKQFIEVFRPMVKPPPLSKEEQERLRARMVRYGKLKRMEHNDMHRRMNAHCRAKYLALNALPNHRRIEAMETEPPQFPVTMPLPTETPPIEGFDITQFSSSN